MFKMPQPIQETNIPAATDDGYWKKILVFNLLSDEDAKIAAGHYFTERHGFYFAGRPSIEHKNGFTTITQMGGMDI